MKQEIINFVRRTKFSFVILFPNRVKLVFGYYKDLLPQIFSWLFKSKETTNLTYDLKDINKLYLIALISNVTKTDPSLAEKYLKEIEKDRYLKNHIKKMTDKSDFGHVSDRKAFFGRRIGWYLIVRIQKPKVVVETGVDKGLGSCLIAAALMKNSAEGYMGKYYGTDINPVAGFLFTKPYSDFGEIIYGDSVESLKRFDKKIDVFISDSVHTYKYEAREYKTVENNLGRNSIIIADNAHNNTALFDFAKKTNRKFLFFGEKPKDHWYPGGGMGVAFR